MGRGGVPARFWTMKRAALARATAIYDREFIIDTFGPPPRAALLKWRRAQRRWARKTRADRSTQGSG